jgi:hypothetical protein
MSGDYLPGEQMRTGAMMGLISAPTTNGSVMGALNILIAVAIGVIIWRVSMYFIRLLATPPPEVDPEDVVPTRQDFKCTVCGTEVTMTVQNVMTEEHAPRHCREDMVPVWRP